METAINIKKIKELQKRMLENESKMKSGFDKALFNLGVHLVNQEKK